MSRFLPLSPFLSRTLPRPCPLRRRVPRRAVLPLRGLLVAEQQGGWWGLHSVFEQSRQEFDAYWSNPPVACPICGQPLVNAPSTKSGSGIELYCNYAGDHEFQYPRDWNPPVRLDSGGLVSPL